MPIALRRLGIGSETNAMVRGALSAAVGVVAVLALVPTSAVNANGGSVRSKAVAVTAA
jgi:hypothetical protein